MHKNLHEKVSKKFNWISKPNIYTKCTPLIFNSIIHINTIACEDCNFLTNPMKVNIQGLAKVPDTF